MTDRPTRSRWPLAALAVAAAMVGMLCMGVPGVDLLFHLLAGWVAFLGRVLPRLTVRWDVVASSVVYAAAFVVGSHLFLRWLYRELRHPTEPPGPADPPPPTPAAAAYRLPPTAWPWRWTLGLAALVLLMFVAGTAAVGITHQAAWLARSPKPMYTSERPANRIKCASNLRQIGMALLLYADANRGRYPDTLAPLLSDTDLHASCLVCPSSNDVPPPGDAPAEQAASLAKPGHCSYLYVGKGLTRTNDPTTVLALEPPEHHADQGVNVLFGDAHTEWRPIEAAHDLLTRHGFERVDGTKADATKVDGNKPPRDAR